MAKNRRMRPLSDSVLLEGRSLWSVNANPGVAIRGESLRKFRGVEHRRWDPNRSKLAAALLRTRNNPSDLLPQAGSTVLYLGAGHGTTISHLHDHLCGSGNKKRRLIAGFCTNLVYLGMRGSLRLGVFCSVKGELAVSRRSSSRSAGPTLAVRRFLANLNWLASLEQRVSVIEKPVRLLFRLRN